MIQRIQTLFILAAEMLIASLFFVNLADLSVNDELFTFSVKGIYNGETLVFDGLPLIVFIGLIVLLHLVVVFMYKKRIRQIRMLSFTIILLIGLFGLFFYFAYAGFDAPQVAFKVPVAFPVVAAILDFLAIRAIGKDEALVRSMDRIR